MTARLATGAGRYAGNAFACDPRSTSIQAEWGGPSPAEVRVVKPNGGQKVDFHHFRALQNLKDLMDQFRPRKGVSLGHVGRN